MKNIIIILFFLPLLASSQGAIVDAGGNIINYQKYTDSVPGVYATGTRLRIKADSVALALVASLALKLNLSDSAAMLGGYLRKTGSAATLTNFPTLNQNTTGTAGGLSANITESQVTNLVSDLSAKQATLVSGTNIKTINGATVLGSGDLVVSGAAAWGSVTGTLSNQTDLQTALNAKAPLASPTFTGTVSGITATMVGLGNVTNESKATMFTSPAFTGTPTGIGIPTYARVTGSNVTTTGQTLVNITGLSIALVANATYEFEAVLSVSTTAVTTGTAYGVNYSAAGATVEAHITGASTSTAAKTLRISALNTATTLYLATSAQTGGILIKGIVTTGANAGNFTISHLKLTSGTSTVFINSFLKCTRII